MSCAAYQLIFAASDVGDFHVVGGRRQILKFLAGKDVDGGQMDFGVTVLASLGGSHFDDLARAALDDDKTVLPQGRTLHRVRGRGAGIGTVKGVLMLRIQISQTPAQCWTFTAGPRWWGKIAQEGWARTCASFGLSAMLMEVSRMSDKEGRYKQKLGLSSAMMGDTRVCCGAKMVNGWRRRKWTELSGAAKSSALEADQASVV